MQPINYSALINVLALLIGGGLSWFLRDPLILVLMVILQTHIPTRHDTPEEEEEEPEPAIGFNAKL